MTNEQEHIEDEIFQEIKPDLHENFKITINEISSEKEISKNLAEKLYLKFIKNFLGEL